MNRLSKYDVIAVAYKSRILFATDAEYRRVLGVSFETVVNNRDSSRDTSIYYDILNGECESRIDRSLREVISDYVLASEYFLTVDWGDRTQMSSRKRFCRMLFRLYATAGMELSIDEILKFKIKDDDERLMEIFFPDGATEAPAVDIGFILLFAFGVLKPWTDGDGRRSRDIRPAELERALLKLRDLLDILADDMPRLGSTEKPLAFYEWRETIDACLNDREALAEVDPLWMLYSVMAVTEACRSLVSSEQRRITMDRFQGYDMPGIWIDNADLGRTRFWIFPDNLLVAFCFDRHDSGWQLTPYEFMVLFAPEGLPDGFILTAPKGNLAHTLTPDTTIDVD